MLGRVLQVTRFDFAADNPMKIVVPGHFNADLCFYQVYHEKGALRGAGKVLVR